MLPFGFKLSLQQTQGIIGFRVIQKSFLDEQAGLVYLYLVLTNFLLQLYEPSRLISFRHAITLHET
ncbi:hypothetical protein EGJ50_15585 [Pseudomonas luteola]|nr:hypothetical protein EGJ50_15585 [Pseudomonas luteola]